MTDRTRAEEGGGIRRETLVMPGESVLSKLPSYSAKCIGCSAAACRVHAPYGQILH
jgi:hypothetical protein